MNPWMEVHDIVQEAGSKTIPKKNKCKKAKWLSQEGLQIAAKTRPGADCGSDHELLIAKFRLKLKKVEKITRPFRYDLNQILMIIQRK